MADFDEINTEKTRTNIFSKLAGGKGKGRLNTVIQQNLVEPTVKVEECLNTESVSLNWLTTTKKVVEDRERKSTRHYNGNYHSSP